jgi:hypothetical protein
MVAERLYGEKELFYEKGYYKATQTQACDGRECSNKCTGCFSTSKNEHQA